MTSAPHLHRRHFIIAAGTAGVLATSRDGGLVSAVQAKEAKALPPYVAWKDPQAVIVHSTNTIETKRDAFGTTGMTPDEELYVRNNLPAPSEKIVKDRDAWQLSIEGVRQPRTMTLGELKKLGIESIIAVLQCSGNGRAFFDHKASGTQWSVGAAGNVFWSGVPLRTVAEALGGVADGRMFITGTGGETLPDGIDPKKVIVERSVPVEAMEHGLLAWEMNGRPVPLAHGGPLRLVLPGYYGVNNVKYLKRLAFTKTESEASIQQTGYRVRPVGVKGAPSQPSMWEMDVKSWVTHPLKETDKGPVQIYGVAFGGNQSVAHVDVSTDGGKTWKRAQFLGPDLGRFAWRPFVLAADLKPGTYTVASRATDAKGSTQPEQFEPNERGYGHNGWRAHAVDVTVT
ncbi:MAG: molybdopterin-dependent oxidoreductase [Rhizobiales bacterium]|nr:molybdopterin-dependent oxidoreductase [Hyphomicrobiales bacterium]